MRCGTMGGLVENKIKSYKEKIINSLKEFARSKHQESLDFNSAIWHCIDIINNTEEDKIEST